jgi:ATP-dependent RNA helicase MSS116
MQHRNLAEVKYSFSMRPKDSWKWFFLFFLWGKGFKEETDRIVKNIPKEHETLLFSATINKETKDIESRTLNANYKILDCIPKDEVDSHMKIRQYYILAPYSQQLPHMMDVIRKHQAAQENGGKVIVFFPTANLVQCMSQVFNRLPQMEVMEIHSRLTRQTMSCFTSWCGYGINKWYSYNI